MAAKWFAFVGTLFLFIWFSNMIGYLPLPTNTEQKVNIFGLQIPSLALYAATANLSVPLVLALVVWISYHIEGIRAKGFIGYIKGWIPKGTPRFLIPLVFPIEVISQFMRLVSLSVRLFANILAGHLIILFMGGGLAVILELAVIGSVILGLVAVARRSRSTSSRSAWSRPCKPSSSPRSRPSTSARRRPLTTDRGGSTMNFHLIPASSG